MVDCKVIGYNMYVVTIRFREQGPNRAVNKASKQGRRFRRFAFSFYKAAGNLADSIHFFFIVYS